MESVDGHNRKQNRRFVLLTGLISLGLGILLLQAPFVNQLEARMGDSCFWVLHWWNAKSDSRSSASTQDPFQAEWGNVISAPQVGFVAIDDRSVDPGYSSYASQWGRDGWLTRGLWNMFQDQMGQIYLPKVLAYDILFRPIPRSKTTTSMDADIKTAQDLERRGNLNFQNELINFADARALGQPAPRVLFAFDFADGLSFNTPLQQDEQDMQQKWFHRLDQFRLPEGSVAPGGTPLIHRYVRLPMDEILSAPSYFLAPINVEPDEDGTYRHVPLVYAYEDPVSHKVSYLPGFAVEAFLLWLGIEPQDLKKSGEGLPFLSVEPGVEVKIETAQGLWTLPIDEQFRMPIVPRFVFKTPENTKPEMFRPSFVDLLKLGMVDQANGSPEPNSPVQFTKFDPKYLQETVAHTSNMILVVSEAFTGGDDAGNLPLEQIAPRALVHVHALSNIMQNDHLYEVSFGVKVLICLVLAVIITWLCLKLPSRPAEIASVLLILLYPILGVVLLLSRNVELPLVAPSFLSLFCFSVNSFQVYQITRRERAAIRRLLSSVTSPRILKLIEENPAAFYAHRKTRATMFFSDVEGFTSLSEKLDPDYLASLINRYLSPMTDIIIDLDGYLDKYSGDGIMAVWSAPLPDAEQEYKACAAALRQTQVAAALEETLPNGKPYRFRIRIGINTGVVSAGNMGSAQKMQYTVMGDEVNLAARLEPINKDYGTQIIIGPETFAGAKGRIYARKLDKIIVKGRVEAALIYELLGMVEAKTPSPGAWVEAYEEGLNCLWKRQWDEAERLFEKAEQLRGGDMASKVQRERIKLYRIDPPADDWQGEFARLKKD